MGSRRSHDGALSPGSALRFGRDDRGERPNSAAPEPRKSAGGVRRKAKRSRFNSGAAKETSAVVGAGHRRAMQGWFSQIVIGVIVTVLGTLIANSVTGGRAGHHFASGYHGHRR